MGKIQNIKSKRKLNKNFKEFCNISINKIKIFNNLNSYGCFMVTEEVDVIAAEAEPPAVRLSLLHRFSDVDGDGR